jgi:hypothetical protein
MPNIANHKAIAMIELIFAIVIMAIVLMSAPLLIHQSVKSSFVGMQQESINTLSSHLSLILTKEWDEKNANTQFNPSILVVKGGDDKLGIKNENRYRAGTFNPSKRTFATDNGGNTATASLTSNFGEDADGTEKFNDIDDYDGNKAILSVFGSKTVGGSDYIDTKIEMKTSVSYAKDSTDSGDYNNDDTLIFNHPFNDTQNLSSNIKLISVVLTTTNKAKELEKNIRLSAFACNIGNYSLSRRDY